VIFNNNYYDDIGKSLSKFDVISTDIFGIYNKTAFDVNLTQYKTHTHSKIKFSNDFKVIEIFFDENIDPIFIFVVIQVLIAMCYFQILIIMRCVCYFKKVQTQKK
jgi:hypothetical protein